MTKRILSLLCGLGLAVAAQAQTQSVAEIVQGSEFRYTKGNIDVQVLSNLIAERQKALSNEVLHRYLLQNQAGALSQNILNEQLIEQLLNNHTPKEITQGIYSYTMETFALGMMSLALEKSADFAFNACSESDTNENFRRVMSDPCKKKLQDGPLKSVYVVDSLLRLMERTQDTMRQEAAQQQQAESVTIDLVIEHISRQAKTAKLVEETRRRLKSIRVAYPQEIWPSLIMLRKQFLTDLAYVVASDSAGLFSRTLFRNGSSKGYLKSQFRAKILNRWMLNPQDFERASAGLKSSLFDLAEAKMTEVKSQLLRSTISEYVNVNTDDAFGLKQLEIDLASQLKESKILPKEICESSSRVETGLTMPELFNRIVGCNDSVAKRKIPLEDIERSISFVEKKPSELANLNAYGYLQEEPLKAKVNEIRSLVLDKMDPAAFEKKKSGLLTQKQRLIDLYDSISTLIAKLEAISPGKNDSDSVWREFVLDSLPLMVAKSLPEGSEIIDYAGIQELNDRVGERMPLGELKERFRRTAEKLDGSAKAMKIFIGIFDKIQSIPMPRANYFDTLIGYRNIVKITAKAISPGKADDAIRNVKILLDGLVVKDTVAVRLVGEYDKYLSLWLMNSRTTRDSTRDTLALLFLQRFLPALRNASFSDSGIKKLYKRSIPLIGFVKLPDIKSAQENIASDPLLSLLIPWVASYSTRTRSQNLQAAVQLMRDNDTLFAKLIPSSSTREWIWLITDGFDIDTAKDVISVEIPKLLTKIEKKYQNEVKAASLPIYPILDIGIFSAVAYGKDTTDFIQVASEKVGFGFAFWRAKSTPTEALIEDPYDRSGEAGVSFVEKAGLEFHASGLLYNSTNMKTNKSFNDALFSFGLGVYFRLGITARVAYGWGYNHGDLQHRVLQAAMDVPLADYLVELGKKN